MSDWLGYIKFGAAWSLLIAFFVSLIVLTVGRIFDHRSAANKGAVGLAVSVGGAALYASAFAIVSGVAGKGC